MKAKKLVAFRASPDVQKLVDRLDSVPFVNRSAVFNAAMLIGLPQAMSEAARGAQQLGDRN